MSKTAAYILYPQLKASFFTLPLCLAVLAPLPLSCSGDVAVQINPPNVLVLSIDTLRADVLGCNGSEYGHTPSLDRLAAKGVVFTDAIAPVSSTFPSHSSMMTGMYPATHGVRWNGDSLTPSSTTLAEQLSAHGWNTGAFVSHKGMLTRGGLHQGFQKLSDPVNPKAPGPGARSARAVNKLAFEFLDHLDPEDRGGKNFLWLHYFTPHSPYPLTDYAKAAMVSYEGPLKDGATTDEFYDLCSPEHQSPEAFAAARSLYEGRVRKADQYVQELLDGLEDRGLIDSTIIIIISDHGQLLGEHQRTGHGAAVIWEKGLEVPFIVVDPRESAPAVISGRVGVVDLAPTVLELVGLKSTVIPQGRSLVSALRGGKLEDALYYAEVRIANPRQTRPEHQKDAIAVYHHDYKFIYEDDGNKESLYDLSIDPEEAHPIPLDQEESVVKHLRRLAILHAKSRLENIEHEDEISEDIMREMAELGYVD